MHHWLRSVILPCSLAALIVAACGGDKKSNSGSNGTGGESSTGSGGTSSTTSATTSTSANGGSGATTGSGGGSVTGTGGTGGTLVDQTGSSCETADDCYKNLAEEPNGEIMCLDRVEDGYCTHECEDDTDCCAVEGECNDAFTHVCSPFESTGLQLCFLSCEDEDVLLGAAGAASADANEFCQTHAGPDFVCRSTGGGADNRKVCVPQDPTIGAGGAAGAGGEGGQPGRGRP